ncbi:MAG: hypothetical protein ACQ9ET_03150 [Nitrosomonadaceae bacterium]
MGDEAAASAQVAVVDENTPEAGSNKPSSTAYLWAMLIARVYEVFPLICPQCGDELKIVAFLTESDSIQRILIHIDEPTTPPRIAPARAPPDWLDADFDQTAPNESETPEPIPEFEFDQTVSW